MASEMVLAYGDHGLEPTPVEDVIEIGCIPLGAGNVVTPRARRYLQRSPGEGVPTKLLRVEKPSKRNGLAHVLVRYECTPLMQYMTDEGPKYLHRWGCQVPTLDDAADPLFDGLTEREKARIARAVRSVTGG